MNFYYNSASVYHFYVGRRQYLTRAGHRTHLRSVQVGDIFSYEPISASFGGSFLEAYQISPSAGRV